jgi:hypothetical protein
MGGRGDGGCDLFRLCSASGTESMARITGKINQWINGSWPFFAGAARRGLRLLLLLLFPKTLTLLK